MSDRTILNPQYSNSLNNLFTGSGNLSIDTLTTNHALFNSLTTGTSYNIDCYSNDLSINSGSASVIPSLQLTNAEVGVILQCPANNVLQTTAIKLANTSGNVLIEPITTDYLGLVNTTTNTNTGNIQGGTFNALTSVTSPVYNIFDASGGANTDITFNGTGAFINIPSNLYVNQSMSAGNYQGGLYSGQFTTNPPRTLPPSGTSQYVFNIPWNPTANWTVDTIIPLFTFSSDYPTIINSYSLVANGSYQLQITLNTSNGSGTESSNIYAINYLIMNNT
jgi:hypothetical protein